MFKKIICISIFMITTTLYAETCPSVLDIKNNYFHDWTPLNIESGIPASNTMLEKFKENVIRFKLAEWMKDAPEGSAHCFYSDALSKDIPYSTVYFAKSNLEPRTIGNWQDVNKIIKHCYGELSSCQFQ